MTRRDTIIVAALVNAGLLIVLFVSALKTEEGKEEVVVTSEIPAIINQEIAFKSEAKRVMGDEVDRVLQQYAQSNPLQPVTEIIPQTVAKQETVHSFVEDLKIATEKASKELTPASVVVESSLAVTQSSTMQEVVVKKGDALEKIARNHHTTVADIMKRNGLVSTQLKIGQVLKISPSLEKKVEEKITQENKSLDPTSAKYYTVKPGDNPWTIAVKNHIKVEELLKLNNMSEERARKLKPGEKIRIR